MAWNKFYERYAALIHFIGRQKQLTPEECSDLTIEVMTIFWKKMDRFVYDRNQGRFRSYPGKIASFCALLLNSRKQKQQRRFKALDDVENYPDEIDETFMDEWRDYLLSKALEDLKEKVDTETFQVFYMSFVQKYSVREISAVTRNLISIDFSPPDDDNLIY